MITKPAIVYANQRRSDLYGFSCQLAFKVDIFDKTGDLWTFTGERSLKKR